MPTIEPGSTAKCPHCQTVVMFIKPDSGPSTVYAYAKKQKIETTSAQCPNCRRIVVTIGELRDTEGPVSMAVSEMLVWPLTGGRPAALLDVPVQIAQDFNEACIVLPLSHKASAALSRRCLQSVLSDAGKTAARDLSKQIEEVLPRLPTYVGENLDAVRNIGNFAAHQIKSTSTGTIVEVEPGEAEWNLDVLEALFDFYYVRPSIEKKKREELDKKLTDAGKPPMKKV